SPLLSTTIELRESINKALSTILVQTVSFEGGNVTLTTVNSVKAMSLNSKVFAFLHRIPSTTTVHLDSPASQFLVHGIPTCHSLATCRWYTIRHLTGIYSYLTATCRVRGHPHSHSTVRCVNCGGPHDAHSPTCLHRPAHPFSDELEEAEETIEDETRLVPFCSS